MTDEQLQKELSPQGISVIRRIHSFKNNQKVPTNLFIVTFCKPSLPQSIKVAYLNVKVQPYIPNALRCFKCQEFVHFQATVSTTLSAPGAMKFLTMIKVLAKT